MGKPVGRPSASHPLPFVALAITALAALALQLYNVAGTFLSDDFGHLGVIARFAERDALGAWTLARFYEPLDSGNFAYRPLAFVTYALDWVAWRGNALGWRATSLAFFALIALAAGVLVTRWLSAWSPNAMLAGVLAGCLLAAYPFAGEISYWLVGRFDLLVCLFTLLYLLALPLAARSSARQHALRIAWLLCALLSKESALPLPFIATLLVFACTAADTGRNAANIARSLRTTVGAMWPSWVVLVGYLGWRIHLFGTPWKVYPSSTPPRDIAQWWERTSGIVNIAQENAGAHYLIGALVAAVLVVAIAFAGFRATRNASRQAPALLLALLAAAALYFVAPGLSFPVSSPSGEGGRHFYLGWAYVSLLVGVLAAGQRWATTLGAALVALMLAAQAHSLAQWHAAGIRMQAIVAGVGRFAPSIAEDEYALLLLPDHIGVALFARTAQGVIVGPQVQRRDFLPRIAVMLGTDFPVWSRFITDGKIAQLKGAAAFDPERFVGLYCWNEAKGTFVVLTDGAVALEPQRWQAMAKQNFADAGCLAPF
ncbi:MAG: hypothetical protein ABI624_14450 [Casimicrobiaceae bacterium]